MRCGDDRIVLRRAEQELRAALGGFGRDVPAFCKLTVSREDDYNRFRFVVEFDRKPRIGWFIPVEELTRAGRDAVLDPSFELEFRSLYSRLYEDHLINLDLNVARRTYLEMVRVTIDPAQLDTARATFEAHAAMIRDSHRGRWRIGLDAGRPGGDRTAIAVRDQIRGRRADLMIVDEVVTVDWSQMTSTVVMPEPAPATAEMVARMTELRDHVFNEMFSCPVRSDANGGYLIPDHFTDALRHVLSYVGDDKAQQKGIKLLKDWLSPEQLSQYERTTSFEVKGGSTGKRYRINHGRQMNIDVLDRKGRRVAGLCFLPEGQLVAGDIMLAQKIALETNERAALAVANRF